MSGTGAEQGLLISPGHLPRTFLCRQLQCMPCLAVRQAAALAVLEQMGRLHRLRQMARVSQFRLKHQRTPPALHPFLQLRQRCCSLQLQRLATTSSRLHQQSAARLRPVHLPLLRVQRPCRLACGKEASGTRSPAAQL